MEKNIFNLKKFLRVSNEFAGAAATDCASNIAKFPSRPLSTEKHESLNENGH